MKFVCNGCDHEITPPRLWNAVKTFACKVCGMRYEQQAVREIKEIK